MNVFSEVLLFILCNIVNRRRLLIEDQPKSCCAKARKTKCFLFSQRGAMALPWALLNAKALPRASASLIVMMAIMVVMVMLAIMMTVVICFNLVFAQGFVETAA
jgi:hypothetical protein